MTLTFHSPIMEEVERGLLSDDLEQRKEAFKDDEELMKETTRFISDVIETATTEATRRKYQQSVINQLIKLCSIIFCVHQFSVLFSVSGIPD